MKFQFKVNRLSLLSSGILLVVRSQLFALETHKKTGGGDVCERDKREYFF